MIDFIIVIPARYESSRLPGKPLVDIAGKPMIQRTYEQCLKAVSPELIYVATDDKRIAEVVTDFGGQIVMTSGDCLTGTDRIAEVAQQIDVDYYINVQGDEPIFNPKDISECIDACQINKGSVINGYCPIEEEELFFSTSIPKVVFRPDGRLLYMSRAGIPGNKSNQFNFGFRQVCIYAYPKKALIDFSERDTKTKLEKEEDIEVLRFLEMGYEVHMIPLSSESIAVDHIEDVDKVLKYLNTNAS